MQASHDAEEMNVRNCNMIREGKRKLEGNSRIWDNNTKMDPKETIFTLKFNPLNPELNPICYLLALLGAHHFSHVSRIRVKLLTFRRLMSYIYIYICSTHS